MAYISCCTYLISTLEEMWQVHLAALFCPLLAGFAPFTRVKHFCPGKSQKVGI
jgi:hypothetical protein